MLLLMCVSKDGASCLYIAAQEGHAAVVEVGVGGGRQREAVGRVLAATAHGTWCRGCRQHSATPLFNTNRISSLPVSGLTTRYLRFQNRYYFLRKVSCWFEVPHSKTW